MNLIKWIEKEQAKREKRIAKAFRNPQIRDFLEHKQLELEDLKEADRRIQMLAIRESAKKKALRDIEVLRLLFSLLKADRTWDLDSHLKWSCFVIDRYSFGGSLLSKLLFGLSWLFLIALFTCPFWRIQDYTSDGTLVSSRWPWELVVGCTVAWFCTAYLSYRLAGGRRNPYIYKQNSGGK